MPKTTQQGQDWRASDAEIMAWAERHDLTSHSLTDLRAALDDARSLHRAEESSHV